MKRLGTVLVLLFIFSSATAIAQEAVVDSLAVTPSTATVATGDTLRFSAAAYDSDGVAIEADITWSVLGGIGDIDTSGLFTAGTGGDGYVVAAAGEDSAMADVTVTEPPAEPEIASVAIYPDEADVQTGETFQFTATVTDTGDEVVDDAVVDWSVVDDTVGTVDADGLFSALTVGTTQVIAAYESFSDTEDVTVTEPLPEEVNTIVVKRVMPGGIIKNLGGVSTEGDTVHVGGLPHPFNYLNGMQIYFPEGSLSQDITIYIMVPWFGHVQNGKDLEFDAEEVDGDIITAVTFEVRDAEGNVVEPFVFDLPVTVSLPFKRGLLNNLDIDPEDLTMYYVGQEGNLFREGIGYTDVVDGEDMIGGTFEHFSSIAVTTGEGPGGPGVEYPSVTIFPKKAVAAIGDTVQFHAAAVDAEEAEVEDAVIVWSVLDELVGSVDEDGQFIALAEGETMVVATWESLADSVEVEVTEAGLVLPEGVNTITIQRQFPDGKITKFGSTVAEGDTVTIGGLPHPFNYLNGMMLVFPDNSLSDDITITIMIPTFGRVNNVTNEVEYDYDYIITGVTFVVSVNGEVVDPFVFDTPIEVMLPYKKGLLTNLGIDIADLDMYYVGQLGDLVRDGVSGVTANEDEEVIVGQAVHFSTLALATDSPTAIADQPGPSGYGLAQNNPNPFNPSTSIAYTLPGSGRVRIAIYNVMGQEVRTLVDEMVPAGNHVVVWNGRDNSGRQVTSGIYFYRMTTSGFSQTRKLMLLK